MEIIKSILLDSSFFSPTGALPNSCASTEVASKTVESARAQGVVPPKLFITSFSECGAIKDGSSPPGGIRSPPSWSRAPRCEPQGGLPPPAKVTSAFISAGSTRSATRRFFERATKIHTPSTKPPHATPHFSLHVPKICLYSTEAQASLALAPFSPICPIS